MDLSAELYKWAWTADGMGNPVDDVALVALGYLAHKLGLFRKVKHWLLAEVHDAHARAAAHRHWQAQLLVDLHHEVTGRPPAPHPEHGQIKPTITEEPPE